MSSIANTDSEPSSVISSVDEYGTSLNQESANRPDPNPFSQQIDFQTSCVKDGPSSRDESLSTETFLRRELLAREQTIDELRSIFRSTLRDRELITAIAKKKLVDGATEQLLRLWRDDFDVSEASGKYRVTSRDGLTVEEAINERLKLAEYSHFCAPSSLGGVASRGVSQSDGETTPIMARTLGDTIINQWRDASVSRGPRDRGLAGWGRRS
jgi:hypothetical protein